MILECNIENNNVLILPLNNNLIACKSMASNMLAIFYIGNSESRTAWIAIFYV